LKNERDISKMKYKIEKLNMKKDDDTSAVTVRKDQSTSVTTSSLLRMTSLGLDGPQEQPQQQQQQQLPSPLLLPPIPTLPPAAVITTTTIATSQISTDSAASISTTNDRRTMMKRRRRSWDENDNTQDTTTVADVDKDDDNITPQQQQQVDDGSEQHQEQDIKVDRKEEDKENMYEITWVNQDCEAHIRCHNREQHTNDIQQQQQSTMICFKGRGYMQNITPTPSISTVPKTTTAVDDAMSETILNDDDNNNNCNNADNNQTGRIINVHGYHLYPQNHKSRCCCRSSNNNDNNNNNNNTTSGTNRCIGSCTTDDNSYYFESANWSSWITIPYLLPGQVLRIYSSSSNNNNNRNDVTREQSLGRQKTFEIHFVKGNETNGQVRRYEARPTIFPTSWCTAIQAIVKDYVSIAGVCDRRPTTFTNTTNNSVDKTTVESQLPPLQTYNHLSFFQDSVLDIYNDDDNDDDAANTNDDIHDDNVNVVDTNGTIKMDASNNNKNNNCTNTKLDHDIISNQHGYQIVICGAKNVGKSTCLRYCINALLNVVTHRGIMVLDADLGQPEYTVPGMVQLTHVTVPNFIPPHESQIRNQIPSRSTTGIVIDRDKKCDKRHNTVVAQHYFGSITSSSDPIAYIQCVGSLLNKYKEYCKETNPTCGMDNSNTSTETRKDLPIPLLINLDGWTKELGYEILCTLLQDTFQLRHVLQISGNTISKMFDITSSITTNHRTILHKCDAYNIQPTLSNAESNRQKAIEDTCKDLNVDTNTHDSANIENIVPDNIDDDCNDEVVRQPLKVDCIENGNDSNVKNPTPIIPTTSIIPAALLRDIRLITYFMQIGNNTHNNSNDTNSNDTNKTNTNCSNTTCPTLFDTSSLWDCIRVSSQQGIDDSQLYLIGTTLAQAKPYVISLDSVQVRFPISELHNDFSGTADDDNYLLDALNGSLVGLCTLPEMTEHFDMTTTVLLQCYGLGLVRAIDRKRRLLFLLTPLDIDHLQAVNCLTIGSNIHLPVQCYFRGPYSESFPYISFAEYDPVHVLGGDPMKSRNNITRRGQANAGGG
jgi:mRNA cleavage and polyadenylation factor CLP1 P-loop